MPEPYSTIVRWLAFGFLIIPLVELWLLFQVGGVLGFGPTVAFVVGTALVGALLAKREGLRVLRNWRTALAEMRVPDEGLTSGLLVLAGAILLIAPGVLTDVVGILLLIPASRKRVAAIVERHLAQRFSGGLHVAVPGKAGRMESAPRHNGRVRVIEVDGKLIDER